MPRLALLLQPGSLALVQRPASSLGLERVLAFAQAELLEVLALLPVSPRQFAALDSAIAQFIQASSWQQVRLLARE